MPLAVSYPGVYVQSIVQPTAPASGVATSLAAFLGRAVMGPVNEPVVLNQWGDYQRVFGGLSQDSSASYQVNAFFNNGGGQALGVRLFEPTLAGDAEKEADVTAAAARMIGDARTAVAKLYASDPAAPEKVPVPTRAAVAGAVSTAFDPAGQKPEGIVASRMLLPAWTSRSASLADPPGQPAVSSILDGLAGGSYTFTATIVLDPLSPIGEAVNGLLQTLRTEAEDPNAKPEKVRLITQRLVNGYAGRPAVHGALSVLQDEVASAPSPSAALYAAVAAVPTAYGKAVPALARPPADPVYGSAVTANANALAVVSVLPPTATSSAMGRVMTAQAAFRAAASGTTAAAVQSAVDEVVGASFKDDPGAKAVQAAVKEGSVTDVKKAEDAAASALAAGFAADAQSTATPQAAAAVAVVRANTDATYDELVVLIGQGVMDTVAWPSGAALALHAKSPGAWGNRLSVGIDDNGISDVVARSLGFASASAMFNVTIVYEDPSGASRTEAFTNVTMDPAFPGLYLPDVLDHESNFVSFGGGTMAVPGAAGRGTGGSDSLPISMTTYLGDQNRKSGIYALEKTPIFNILCIPPDLSEGDTPSLVYQAAAQYCVARNAMLIADPPSAWQDAFVQGDMTKVSLDALGPLGADEGRSSAVYFPRVVVADPLRNGHARTLPNCGYVAGLWAQTDATTGLWKAPAGLSAALNGVVGLAADLSDVQNGVLNPIGINCLRTFPLAGSVVWGARTMRGADQLGDQYGYIPVRRTLLYLMDWAMQNTKWAVFQPNGEALWSSLRVQFSNLMNGLWKQGAFFGTGADQAYFVKCDATTTLQADIDAGRVNIQIGFAPVKPAEFVVVTLQQKTAASS